jgi:hypothetical protein
MKGLWQTDPSQVAASLPLSVVIIILLAIQTTTEFMCTPPGCYFTPCVCVHLLLAYTVRSW